MKFCKFLLLASILLAVTSCSKENIDATSYPKSRAEREREQAGGSVFGDAGLLSFGAHDKSSGYGVNIGVNSYLWRATLDVISFMPLLSADPFGGVIITDWYEDPKASGERFKMNIMIMSSVLNADGVKVTVFKQIKDNKGNWVEAVVSPTIATDIEDRILTHARKLKIAHHE